MILHKCDSSSLWRAKYNQYPVPSHALESPVTLNDHNACYNRGASTKVHAHASYSRTPGVLPGSKEDERASKSLYHCIVGKPHDLWSLALAKRWLASSSRLHKYTIAYKYSVSRPYLSATKIHITSSHSKSQSH